MTSAPVAGQNWVAYRQDSPPAGAQRSETIPVTSAPIAQLQGVLMALRGVSAEAATSQLHWHGTQLNVTVADLAGSVMRSITAILGELLAGGPPPVAAPPNPEHHHHHRDQFRDGSYASALHLVAADHDHATPDVAERWVWERVGLRRRGSQVLRLIGDGLSNQEIATTLFVSVNTVKSYIRTAYRTIGVTTRAQAVR